MDSAAPDLLQQSEEPQAFSLQQVLVQVDLTKCLGYGQCCFAAPEDFWMPGQEALEYSSAVAPERLQHIRAAAAACPVQAISFAESRRTLAPKHARIEKSDLVVVGASLAGLEAALAAHAADPNLTVTLVDPEVSAPYDRPPLSKAFIGDRLKAEQLRLLQVERASEFGRIDKFATGLDRSAQAVLLSDGTMLEFDRLVIATGARARSWPDSHAAGLEGVLTLRSLEDARKLGDKLRAKPRRVCVIGGGFIGTEIASTCRSLDIEVTVLEQGALPLVRALGAPVGEVFARLLREHGVDLRLDTRVKAIHSSGDGHFVGGVELADGSTVECDVVVVALGAVRNTEWLKDAGLLIDERGIATDRFSRVLDSHGEPVANIFAAGDVATSPSWLVNWEQVAVEHWSNALEQGRCAGRNAANRKFKALNTYLPTFWSSQFGLNIKSAGLPGLADSFQVVQGSLASGRFAGLYGQGGRVIGAITIDHGRYMPFLKNLVEQRTRFPQDISPAAGPLNLNRPE